MSEDKGKDMGDEGYKQRYGEAGGQGYNEGGYGNEGVYSQPGYGEAYSQPGYGEAYSQPGYVQPEADPSRQKYESQAASNMPPPPPPPYTILAIPKISSKFFIDPNKPPPGITIEPQFIGQRKVEIEGHLLTAKIPEELLCPHCNYYGNSITEHIVGDFTWLMCCILAFLFFFLMCLPFCITGCKDVRHRCPHCKRSVGRYKILTG